MIELCSVRRMVATIIFLAIVTIISVVIETKYEPKNKSIKNSESTNQLAMGNNDLDNASTDTALCATNIPNPGDCKPCASWQLEHHEEMCKTGYSAPVKCLDKVTYVSCEEPYYIKQRSFWAHEAVWLLMAIISYIFVHFRRSSLDQKVLDRVNKQIASGV